MKTVGETKPKRYQCCYCSTPLLHDECYTHSLYHCPKRPGSTVKAPQPKGA